MLQSGVQGKKKARYQNGSGLLDIKGSQTDQIIGQPLPDGTGIAQHIQKVLL